MSRSNPEFLREGTAIGDFFHPDRIVVGVEGVEADQQLREIYEPIIEGRFECVLHPQGCPQSAKPEFLVTTISSAELIKHASNSFLALKISYANVISVCASASAVTWKRSRARWDSIPRIGQRFLNAGLGFGGFCLPKDVQAFIHLAEQVGVDFGLLKEAERVNRQRIERLMDKVRQHLWVIRDKQIALLGLAFKPFTDDIRPRALAGVIRRLQAEGAKLRATDPEAMERTRAVFRRSPTTRTRTKSRAARTPSWSSPNGRNSKIGLAAASTAKWRGRSILDTRNMLDPPP